MQSLLERAPSPATITLFASVLVIVLLSVGVALARMKRYTAHKWVQTAGVTLNAVLVVAVMLQSFAKAVAPGLPQKLGEAYYAVAVGHGVLGLFAVVVGVFVALRGHGLVPRALQFSNYKLFMRTAYGLYLGATLLGAWVFATWYGGATPGTALATNARQLVVPMANFNFSPRELVVPQGATVVWVNQDGVPHNVVADDGTTLRSDLLTNGQQFTATFDQLGSFPYYCELHGGAGGVDMAAVIRVVPPGEAPAVAAAPAAAPQPTAADALAEAPALPAQARTFIAQLLDDGPGLPTRQGYVSGMQAQAEATSKPGAVTLGGTLPAQALGPIRQILVSAEATPDKIGYVLGLRQETDELLRHAQFLRDAYAANDFALERVHGEHLVNIIRGSEACDANGDGKVQNPGDGYGLLANGQQDGYIKGMVDQAKRAAAAPDATDAIKLHAGHIQTTGENTRQRVDQIRGLAEQVVAAPDRAATEKDVLQILTLAEQTIQGVDINLDEQVGPIPGEGGVITAYQHSQLMASLPLAAQDSTAVVPAPAAPVANAPTAAPVANAPPPALQAKTIEISVADNTFSSKKLTIAPGTTVVWKNVGKRPHTTTADDGSLTSGNLDAGATFSQTFTKAGTFPYYCEYHGGAGGQGMSATIIVADGSAAANPPPQAAPAPTTAPAAAAPTGESVTWKNDGEKRHSATAVDGSFDTGLFGKGESKTVQFNTPGTFRYFCQLHGAQDGSSGMVATVIVE